MELAELNSIGVLGAGQMGAGIAQVAALGGYKVVLADVALEHAEGARAAIQKRLGRSVEKGKLEAGAQAAAMERIVSGVGVEALSACDMAIEAVTENETLKLQLFSQLDEVMKENAILASNTSSISITRIGAATKRPAQVIGMHFMNPVPVMKLVEVIRGLGTSDATLARTQTLAEKLGKRVVTSADYPGFIVNRILMPMINEAVFALMEGVATANDIDVAMQLGTNQPMGPLALADLIGLDTCLSILRVLHQGHGDPKYRPCPLLQRMVDGGRLGRKTGWGFHEYAQ